MQRELAELLAKARELRSQHPFEFWYCVAVVAAVTGCYLADYVNTRTSPFERLVEDAHIGQVRRVSIERAISRNAPVFACVELSDGRRYRVAVMDRTVLAATLGDGGQQIIAEDFIPSRFATLGHLISVTNTFLFLFYAAKLRWGSGGGSPLEAGFLQNVGKSLAKRFTGERGVVRFADVAGLAEAKREVEEFVDFLKAPEKYQRLGAKLPKGALLAGPPGTGKTLLAKACAGEAGVPFFYVSGSEFVQMFVGVGAARVRDLFAEAKKCAPSIVFIDEIDAIGKKRSARLASNSESDSTLNQLLVELDGFKPNSNVTVFAATNRRELLDPALTRPGRIDRIIDVGLPDLAGRKEILLVHLQKLKLAPGTLERHAHRLASLAPGFSGADLANVCNEAGIQAVRSRHTHVEDTDFELAVERIIAGPEKKRQVDIEQERVVAIHESGHGVVAWFLPGADPLLKLTILPRARGSLGFAQYLPTEQALQTREELLDRITAVLAGRCAEEEFFSRVTTGAHDDLRKAQRIAAMIVKRLGMSPLIGQVALEENEHGLRLYSDATLEEVDRECQRLIEECTLRSRELVRVHKDAIRRLSEVLLERKTIDLTVIRSVLGERPFPPREGFAAYLSQSQPAIPSN